MNISWSRKILTQLYAEGVCDLIVCAGARNSSLVAVLAKTKGLELKSFFEERSAAFYALGVARRTHRPVAVVTTSGTASAELLPATIEAFHTGVPLILITADRPRRLRGSGAPQAIDQTGLFAKFVDQEFDLEGGELFNLEGWNRRTPVHINVCFDEPLLDEPLGDLVLSGDDENQSKFPAKPFDVSAGSDWASLRLTKFLRMDGPLLVVVGTLDNEADRQATLKFIKRLQVPTYLEANSGLRECEELQPFALRSGDRCLAWALRKGMVSRVLRIGGVPTVRIWRDLDEPKSTIEVLSISSLPFAGLSRGELVCTDIASVLNTFNLQLERTTASQDLLDKDREVESKLLELYREEPQAEPSLVHELSRLIPTNALCYVGNSLPIREWDLAATYEGCRVVEANRGVNGIDGQISTFLGLSSPERESWAMIGDLTALYDLAAPWPLLGRDDLTFRLVIINNGGGKIFSRLFRDPLFENPHGVEFSNWAKMWNLGYQRWTSVPETMNGSPAEVIELVPDNEASKRFWDRYEGFWK